MRCRECGELLELCERPEVRGRAGDVGVALHGLRALACAAPGHPLEPPRSHFAADLAAALGRGGALPTAASSGWLRRRRACARCGGPLAGEPRTGTLRGRVRLEGAAALTVTLEGPLLHCEACGQAQLDGSPGTGERVADAALAALAAAGLPVRSPRSPAGGQAP